MPHSPHILQFYESDSFLLECLVAYVAEGLSAGGAALVIATPALADGLKAALAGRGMDAAALEAGKRLRIMDAAKTLPGILADGMPEEGRFRASVGEVLAEVESQGRPVRAFGEMVAMLWKEGRDGAAAHLERLWSRLLQDRPVQLLCAFPVGDARHLGTVQSLREIYGRHVEVRPSESFSRPGMTEVDRLRAIAELQFRTASMEGKALEMYRSMEDLRHLHAVSRRLATFSGLEETLKEVLRHAASVYSAEKALLCLTGPDGGGGLHVGASLGFDQDYLAFVDRRLAGPESRDLLARSRTSIVVEDLDADAPAGISLEAARLGGYRALHSVPLFSRLGSHIGVLSFHFTERHRPVRRDMEFGEVYARLAADSIEQAHLWAQANRELDKRRLAEVKLVDHARSLERLNLFSNQREEAANRLAAIVHSSNDAIISKDLESRVTSWNTSAERIFGYSAEEMIGNSITILIPPTHIDEEERILGKIRAGETIDHYETVRRRKDGSLLEISLTVSPIKDGTGKVVGASKIARDITRQKDIEEQLRQSQKMEAVGRLAGGIAHDFNNLLTAINGFADMALQDAPKGSQLEEYLEEIRRSGDRATSLTQQLLAYSRKQMRAPRIIDLNSVVSEMDRLLRRVIGEDIVLHSSLEQGLGRVKADPNQIQQVLLNLVLNARDAMPSGGRLSLRTANAILDDEYAISRLDVAPGPKVMLAVADTGVGMTPEVRERIFEPFFTTKETGKGTGLGLSSVQGIVSQSGGHIAVDSEPGKGTTIRIYFPAVDAPVAGGLNGDGAIPVAPSPRKKVILLAEDESAVRRFLAATLRSRGYEVLEAEDGVKALELGRRAPEIDLLVTDVVMPNMNGGKLAEELRTFHPEAKVLFMSGYTKDMLPPQPLEAGELGFLQKPFTQEELLKKIASIAASAAAKPKS